MLWIENLSGRAVRADTITEARPHEQHRTMQAGASWSVVVGIGPAEENEVTVGACGDQQQARRLTRQLLELINAGGDGVLRLGDAGFERSDFTVH